MINMHDNYDYGLMKQDENGWYNFALHFDVKNEYVRDCLALQVSKVKLENNQLYIYFYKSITPTVHMPKLHICDFHELIKNCNNVKIIEYDTSGNEIESKNYQIKLNKYGHELTDDLKEVIELTYTFTVIEYIFDIIKDGDKNGD